jgi:hypothetical protein
MEVIEVLVYTDRVQHPASIRRIAVGEDEAAARQPRQEPREPIIAFDPIERDIVDVLKEIVRIDLMLLDEPGERRSMGVEVMLLHPPRFLGADVEQALDISCHPLVDERKKPGRRRVQAIVEIEDPIAYMGKTSVHRKTAP